MTESAFSDIASLVSMAFREPYLFLVAIALPVWIATASAASAASASTAPSSSTHWAFQPVRAPVPPTTRNQQWPRNEVDRFILHTLEDHGLHPSPQADRIAWLRRVSFDLIGLPPSPEEVQRFVQDDRSDAYERTVDALLASPRYGERWAQHWLDVVRYADTHGYEVNTERPNAWPYRDYVIRAFNNDLPYTQFIREQLVGDAMGVDEATGFLVTASVLLPGQIGADDVSKRLARQDALDDIVVNTGQTFLGLSIGCARCHDHKFDPITLRDYYSTQAFFAGVEYGDREWRTPVALERFAKAAPLRKRLGEIDRALTRFEPLSRVGAEMPAPTQPQKNEIVFPAREVRFVRFTIHDAAVHPTLGLIEPCIDEFEIFSDEPTPRNVALASFGTRVRASGSRVSGSHRLEHIQDGIYGNEHSWMSDEPGRGWVMFELPKPMRVSKVVWGRDRNGQFQDRLATAYTLEAGLDAGSMERIQSVPPLRVAVRATQNVDRFLPTPAKRLRFTIKATNTLEPCIDEFEVYDLAGTNIALASGGTRVTSSGDTVVAGKHELNRIHDGIYGNANSWMSSENGKGWVAFEFPHEVTIDRVVWGRDRNGEFSDRLATDYQIEVAAQDGIWRVIATAQDRRPFEAGESVASSKRSPLVTAGLTPQEAQVAEALLAERKSVQSTLDAAAMPVAFSGVFRAPDTIHMLNRGDPEQPREIVSPAVLSVLGTLRLPADTPEQKRRMALADWIASADHPLTARVWVNRVWQGHFGIGLVGTPSDFGTNGEKPSHPELLDWLATEFVRSGWRTKWLHRLIVLSATYRQSSQADSQMQTQDSGVRWLWRFPSHRLESEVIRDSMLAVSGQLNLKMGGPGFDLFNLRGGLTGFKPVESYRGEGLRRMIYAHKVRREREAVFGAFDCPDAGQSTARRRESTTPIQALNLFNSPFTLEQSEAFAKRVQQEVGSDNARQIERAYWLALSRTPHRDEMEEARQVVERHGLSTLCRALYNCNEWLFIP